MHFIEFFENFAQLAFLMLGKRLLSHAGRSRVGSSASGTSLQALGNAGISLFRLYIGQLNRQDQMCLHEAALEQ